jgi:tRNA-uridine 2-sulfurtransferase
MQDVKGKKIFVGLSGGVDSAVSTALLKEAGAKVEAVFIKGWYPPGMPCTWAADRRDAMRVAARLHIPFHTLDASAEYKRGVIDYLLSEYKTGRTPNPDIMCNREVKFGVFYRFALAHGADFIATGHYVSGIKDQRYFLWAVPKEAFDRTIFPVGMMDKSEVRRLADTFNLPVADKRDSQGICFLGEVSVKDFLRSELGDNPALLHTLGERVEGGYVAAKNIENGTIEIINGHPTGGKRNIRFRDANWHGASSEVDHAQTRYRGPFLSGAISGSEFTPSEEIPELPVPGQSIVFYCGDRLVGGGIIE